MYGGCGFDFLFCAREHVDRAEPFVDKILEPLAPGALLEAPIARGANDEERVDAVIAIRHRALTQPGGDRNAAEGIGARLNLRVHRPVVEEEETWSHGRCSRLIGRSNSLNHELTNSRTHTHGYSWGSQRAFLELMGMFALSLSLSLSLSHLVLMPLTHPTECPKIPHLVLLGTSALTASTISLRISIAARCPKSPSGVL